MQDKMMDAFTSQTRQMFEPMRKVNSLMLNNMEKLTQYQLDAMKRYSQMGTERMRTASEIQDAEGLQEFASKQAEILNDLSQQMQEDARAVGEMSQQFQSEMEALFHEASQQMNEQATAAAKGDAKQASSQSTRSKN